jgi:hypothetical protein
MGIFVTVTSDVRAVAIMRCELKREVRGGGGFRGL